jgi:uncharacterized membrane protein AbrB (regulator of aidB expression)
VGLLEVCQVVVIMCGEKFKTNLLHQTKKKGLVFVVVCLFYCFCSLYFFIFFFLDIVCSCVTKVPLSLLT